MKVKKLAVEFISVFSVSLAAAAVVMFLWNLIGHGTGAIGWNTSLYFAVIFSIIMT